MAKRADAVSIVPHAIPVPANALPLMDGITEVPAPNFLEFNVGASWMNRPVQPVGDTGAEFEYATACISAASKVTPGD